MAEARKIQTEKISHGNRKTLVAAVCVILFLAVVLFAFLAAKNPIYISLAQKQTAENDFSTAYETVQKASGAQAELLEKYITLRIDINNSYPDLLSDFDEAKINEWNEGAALINEKSDLLGEKLSVDAQLLYQTLLSVTDCISEYAVIRPDILSMMDIFHEINRLHTKDTDGKNIGFTVLEERAKISGWEHQCGLLSDFSLKVPGYESIYLLNYLIKETQGECADLTAAINSVTESGYSETDKVRFSGEGRKTYPDIKSSNNESVNLLEKNNYEFYMYKGICRALVESLAEFYTP